MSKSSDEPLATKSSDDADDATGNAKLAAILAKEILSAKATLPDLPSKKNSGHYDTWRDTVVDDLKTSIYTLTKHLPGGNELFKHFNMLLQVGNPDTTFPANANLNENYKCFLPFFF